MRNKRFMHASIAILPICALLLWPGCGSDEKDEDPSGSATPNPTLSPTPSPNPVPQEKMDDFFRVTEMEFAEPGQGQDLDDDGNPDNGIALALEATVDTALMAIETSLNTIIEELPDDVEVPDGLVNAVLVVANGVLDQIFSVEAMSAALMLPIEDFSINYVLEFQEQDDASVNLMWYSGEQSDSGAFEVDISDAGSVLGALDGEIESDGSARFEGDLTLTFVFNTPSLPDNPIPPIETVQAKSAPAEDLVAELTLHGSIITIPRYDSEHVRDMMAGGAIYVSDMLSLVEEALLAIEDAIPGDIPVELPIEEILAQVELSLMAASDVQIDGEAGISVALDNISADEALVDVLE